MIVLTAIILDFRELKTIFCLTDRRLLCGEMRGREVKQEKEVEEEREVEEMKEWMRGLKRGK